MYCLGPNPASGKMFTLLDLFLSGIVSKSLPHPIGVFRMPPNPPKRHIQQKGKTEKTCVFKKQDLSAPPNKGCDPPQATNHTGSGGHLCVCYFSDVDHAGNEHSHGGFLVAKHRFQSACVLSWESEEHALSSISLLLLLLHHFHAGLQVLSTSARRSFSSLALSGFSLGSSSF